MNTAPATQSIADMDSQDDARWVTSLCSGDVPLGSKAPSTLMMAALAAVSPPPHLRKDPVSHTSTIQSHIRDGARYLGRVADHMDKNTVVTLGGVNGIAALVLWHAARRDFFRG